MSEKQDIASEAETTEQPGNRKVDALVRRLLDHAECHEYIAEDSDEQKLWMNDLRLAASLLEQFEDELERIKDVLCMANDTGEAERSDSL